MKPRLTYANVVATLALFLALGGGSFAAVSLSASGSQLRACVTSRTGALRLLSRGQSCRPNERLVVWNVMGPRGYTGAPGAPGAPGQVGPAGPSTGAAGGDLSGSYPNPTVKSVGGHTAITDATTARGDLAGTFPSLVIKNGQVGAADLGPTAAYCSVSDLGGVSAAPVGYCSGVTVSPGSLHAGPGVYCLNLPTQPAGGAVSIDTLSSGFPVAYMSLNQGIIYTDCGAGYNVLVTTYTGAGGPLADERWYGFFY